MYEKLFQCHLTCKMAGGQSDESKNAGGQSDDSKMAGGQSDESKMAGGQSDESKMAGGQSDESKMAGGQLEESKMAGGQSDESKMAGAQWEDSKMACAQCDERSWFNEWVEPVLEVLCGPASLQKKHTIEVSTTQPLTSALQSLPIKHFSLLHNINTMLL